MNLENFVLDFVSYSETNLTTVLTTVAAAVGVMYLVIILWVLVDINRRTTNPYTKVISVVAVTIGFIPGLVAYLLFRPHQTLSELQESRLYNKKDILIIEPGLIYCSSCYSLNKKEYRYCIDCGTDMNFECPNCLASADPTWTFCPYCKFRIRKEVAIQKRFKHKGVIFPLKKTILSFLRSCTSSIQKFLKFFQHFFKKKGRKL